MEYAAPAIVQRPLLYLLSRFSLVGLFALANASCARLPQTGSVEATSTLYVRADTNDITVWSPRARVDGEVGDALQVESTYTVDAWTGASIDIVTAATKAVHEVRHELSAGASYALADLTLASSYRYSVEPDYTSHGAVASVHSDFAQRNTTLAAFLFAGHDMVGRAGDAAFQRVQQSVGARVAWTQVLDEASLAQLSWESLYVWGYQASPYRFVAIGDQGTCASRALECVPEQVPDERVRHALTARMRRAFGQWLSVGMEYRYYVDSWKLASQTLAPDLRIVLGERATLSLGYRYYTQGEAEFYRPRYFDRASTRGYFTRDRELSALYNHRLNAEYVDAFELGAGGALFNAGVRLGVTRYRYLAFVGLERVMAYEASLLLGLSFPYASQAPSAAQ
jgi:hypothetical protein